MEEAEERDINSKNEVTAPTAREDKVDRKRDTDSGKEGNKCSDEKESRVRPEAPSPKGCHLNNNSFNDALVVGARKGLGPRAQHETVLKQVTPRTPTKRPFDPIKEENSDEQKMLKVDR